MLAASTRSAFSRIVFSRGFATSTRAGQATPLQKPVIEKEFKIYRWVRSLLVETYTRAQNPDEPAKKPTLQTYKIDLNQCGPMVSFRIMLHAWALLRPLHGRRFLMH